jgi:hypothetical protein
MATWDDVPHLSDDQKQALLASIPAHQRDARTRGVPQLGSGAIFPIDDETVACDTFAIPAHWPVLGAMDFGWDHPTAAVKLAWDRDTDAVYITHVHRLREATPVIHAAALRPWGADLKWAWPHDGYQHDKGSGEALAQQYRSQGLKMLPEHAQYEGDRGNGVEAGLMDMLDRMETDRLKVFRHLSEWFEEKRLYHRKDGRVVKERDDIMSATRYGIMSLRFAQIANKPSLSGPKQRMPVPAGGGAWMG